MSNYKFIVYLILGFALPLKAQLFKAGPDQTICAGTGTQLGAPMQVVPSNWCITWSPAAGLDDPHDAFPHANPKKTTIYKVEVLTEDWQTLGTDDVKIIVGFGGLKFTPPFLNQGSQLTSHSEVTINPTNEEVRWSISGAKKGCSIDSITGIITPGTEYGKITIRAEKKNDPDCFADDDIDINEGAKDVEARDFAHPNRVAKGGVDKLYLVGESEAVITAIPNATGFDSDQPTWYSDGSNETQVPSAGQNEIVTPTFAGNGVVKYIAGSMAAGYQPIVSVEHLSTDESPYDLAPFVQKMTARMMDVNERFTKNIKKRFPQVPNLNVEVVIGQLKYKKSKAEKYNDPGWDYKYLFEAGGSMKLSGRIYHPQWTGTLSSPFVEASIGSEMYIEPFFESSLTGSIVKDPSKIYPGWTSVSNPVKFTTTGGIRGVFNVFGQFNGIKVTGGFSLATKISFDVLVYLLNGELKVKITIAPLQGNVKTVIERVVDPKKKYTFFDYTIDLLDKWASPELELFDLGAQQ